MSDPTRLTRALPPVILMVCGACILYEATLMSTFGAIFPALAGVGIILGSLALMGRIALRLPDTRPPPERGMHALLLLAILLAWAVLLPVIGFIPACILGAAATMFLAQDEKAAPRVLAIRSAGLLVTILAVALLFSRGLNVPLP